MGTLVVLAPFLLLPVIAVWIVVLVLSGYVGLSTILAGFAAPIVLAVVRLPDDQPIFIYCTVMAMYIVFSHRLNLKRMRAGSESRMTRAMLFQRRKS
jgi:glycerol-3-phosphate acyltransferase PlsY